MASEIDVLKTSQAETSLLTTDLKDVDNQSQSSEVINDLNDLI